MSKPEEDNGNFASLILRHGVTQAGRKAIIIPKDWNEAVVTEHEEMTYGELTTRIQTLRAGFAAEGLVAGDRVVVLFPVSIDLYAVIIALIASGITAVLIDTGMGAKRIKQSLETAKPKAIISVHAFLKYRFFLWPLWKIPQKYSVDKPGLFVKPFTRLLGQPENVPPIPREPEDEALITFTSGSTGSPKGADRNHGHFREQHLAVKAEYPPQPNQVDMPGFPVVAIHDLCCGITVAIPPVDFANPGKVNPAPLVAYGIEHGVTSMTGAPTYMGILSRYLNERGTPYSGMRQLGVGGAPVSKELCQQLIQAFPAAEGWVVYGSTEAEPIAHARLEDVISHTADGYLVGTTAKAAEVALLNLPKENPELDARGVAPYRVPQGEIGEVVVSGKHVNRGYIDNPTANKECKLFDTTGAVWHRTGDLGYWTDAGLLCLVGRLKDVIRRSDGLVQPYPLESKLEVISGVERAAVLATQNHPNGAIVIAQVGESRQGDVVSAIRQLSALQRFEDMVIYFVPTMPVDGRHNSKVDRPSLRDMIDSGAADRFEDESP
jgi:acyl-CoA synthetase (AMP-forming)/AMP-acid ligase II